MAKKQGVSFKLNGKPVDVVVEPRELLIHTLREKLAHTGPHIGCETSHCGACTVDLDGMSVKSCLQCGFCTPGMIMTTKQLLADHPNPTEQEIRHGLEGNLCRCTGYQNIVKAVQHAAKKLATA